MYLGLVWASKQIIRCLFTIRKVSTRYLISLFRFLFVCLFQLFVQFIYIHRYMIIIIFILCVPKKRRRKQTAKEKEIKPHARAKYILYFIFYLQQSAELISNYYLTHSSLNMIYFLLLHFFNRFIFLIIMKKKRRKTDAISIIN